MEIPWIEIFIFPGFLFILGLTFLFEHISYRLYSRFDFNEKRHPLFIPIFDQFRFCFNAEKEEITIQNAIQSVLIVCMATLGLVTALLLPLTVSGPLPNSSNNYKGGGGKTEGIVGIISFEGDLLLLFSIILFFGILIFFVYWLGNKHTNYQSLKKSLTFMVFDIPLLLAFAGPALSEKSMSLSMLAEDVKIISYLNKGFGIFILIPLGLFVSIIALTLKFDQIYFDRISRTSQIEELPFSKNWKFVLWNLSMRTMEFVIAATIVSIFLGGPFIPIPILDGFEYLAYILNFLFKCSIIFLITTLIKILIPRLQTTQAVNISLKILSPIAILSLILIGGYIAIFGLR